MNLSWLDDFLALALTKNFSRAAELRHMTQPAFGRRIRALEDWLGTELFERGKQATSLTETGDWFSKIAQELLAQVARPPAAAQAIERSAERHVGDEGGSTGRLRGSPTHKKK